MFQFRIRNSYGERATNSNRKLINNLYGTIHNTHCNSITRRWNLFLVSWWTNNFKHHSFSNFNNHLHCHLQSKRMLEFRIRNSNGECCTNGHCELINNLCRPIGNTQCDSINRWWNLLVVPGWANDIQYHSVSRVNGHLHGHVQFRAVHEYSNGFSHRQFGYSLCNHYGDHHDNLLGKRDNLYRNSC